MARRLGDPPTLAEVLVCRAGALVETAERYDEAVELAELANRSNDPAFLFWTQFITSMLALTVGDLHTYVDGLEEGERLANELGQPTMRWAITLHRSVSHRRAGWLEEAEGLGRQALEIGQAAGLPDAGHLFDSYSLYWIRYDQGRLDELVEHFERKVASSGPTPLTLVNLLGLIYNWADDPAPGGTAPNIVPAQGTSTDGGEQPFGNYDLFEGTEQIQQLVISRAISGLHIR